MGKIVDWDDPVGRRLRLRDLRVFFLVAQLGSFANAAAQLRVSQPAVSRIIADLEHTLGVRLFDRSHRGVELTLYGRALLSRGHAAFDELRQGIDDIGSLADPGTGQVRIGAHEVLMAGFVAATIDRLAREASRIVFTTVQGNVRPLHIALRERAVDVIIARRLQSTSEDDFVSETLFDERWFVVAGKKSKWARRRRIDLAELLEERWIVPGPDSVSGRLVAEGFRAKGLAIPKWTMLSDSVSLRNLLLATGRYLTVMRGSTLHFGAEQLLVKVLPVSIPTTSQPTEIAWLKGRTLSPVVERFIEHARNVARSFVTQSRARKS